MISVTSRVVSRVSVSTPLSATCQAPCDLFYTYADALYFLLTCFTVAEMLYYRDFYLFFTLGLLFVDVGGL
jgi:hypothetical protein